MIYEAYKIEDLFKYENAYYIEVTETESIVIQKEGNLIFFNHTIKEVKKQEKYKI